MSGPNGHFDLDAARTAAANEAARQRWHFTFGGKDFSLPANSEWPADAKRMLDNGDLADFLDALLDDPAAFWAVKPRPTNGDVRKLLDAYGEWGGLDDLGESVASPPLASTPI